MRFINETKIKEPKIDVGTIFIEDPNNNDTPIYMVCKTRDSMTGCYEYRIVDLQKYEILSPVFDVFQDIYDYIIDTLMLSTDTMLVYNPGELSLIEDNK